MHALFSNQVLSIFLYLGTSVTSSVYLYSKSNLESAYGSIPELINIRVAATSFSSSANRNLPAVQRLFVPL